MIQGKNPELNPGNPNLEDPSIDPALVNHVHKWKDDWACDCGAMKTSDGSIYLWILRTRESFVAHPVEREVLRPEPRTFDNESKPRKIRRAYKDLLEKWKKEEGEIRE